MKKRYVLPADISAITLITKEQWENVSSTIPNIPIETNWWWWTSSPATGSDGEQKVWCIGREGELHKYGRSYGNCGIRPVITIFGMEADLGDKIIIGSSCTGTAIGKETVLIDTVMSTHRFDENTSSYKDAEIKTFVENEVLRMFKEGINELFR